MPTQPQLDTRFRDRAEMLDFLLEVNEAISETLNLDTVMDNLASAVRKVVPYDLFAILLYSEKRHGLQVRYSRGHRVEVIKHLNIPVSEGITGAAASTKEPVLVGDVRDDSRYLPTVDAVRTELAVPILTRNRLVGVIDLQSSHLNAYTEEDANLVRLIASQVAASIDNARLYRRALRQNHTLQTLATLANNLSSTLDLDALLNETAITIKKLINYDAFSILLADTEKNLLHRRFSLRYDKRVELDNVAMGTGITGAAVESKQPVRVADTRSDERYIESTRGIRSEIAMPLVVQDRVLGVMDLESEQVGYFTEAHVRLLSLLAPLIANSIENASLYEDIITRQQLMARNLRAARDLQSALLLREPPSISGIELAVRSRPAQEVSGDVYDFFEQDGEWDVITFGDVSGKGAAAALYGALVNGLLRTLAPHRRSPADLLQSLNEALGERKVSAVYLTLQVLFWQAMTKTLTIANAGVFPPIICRDGEILKQRVEGIPLGLLDNREYDEITFQTQPGDVILLYSDGIHDQLDFTGNEYGRRRIYTLLECQWEETSDKIADAIFTDVDRFMAGTDITDDQTVIVLKIK